jgi:hypothetical protein
MQRSDFDFDVIGGPSSPPLFPRPTEQRPTTPSAPAPDASLDPAAHRPESPAS